MSWGDEVAELQNIDRQTPEIGIQVSELRFCLGFSE
jgi:hypothetical protein